MRFRDLRKPRSRVSISSSLLLYQPVGWNKKQASSGKVKTCIFPSSWIWRCFQLTVAAIFFLTSNLDIALQHISTSTKQSSTHLHGFAKQKPRKSKKNPFSKAKVFFFSKVTKRKAEPHRGHNTSFSQNRWLFSVSSTAASQETPNLWEASRAGRGANSTSRGQGNGKVSPSQRVQSSGLGRFRKW